MIANDLAWRPEGNRPVSGGYIICNCKYVFIADQEVILRENVSRTTALERGALLGQHFTSLACLTTPVCTECVGRWD